MANKEFLDDDVFKFDDDEKEIKDEVKVVIPPNDARVEEENIVNQNNVEKVEITDKKNKETKRNTKNRKIKCDVAVKKLFSISTKNLKVLDALKKLPNNYTSESEFICQAILEKYDRETNIKATDIKSLVKDALEELVGEKYIIMKGSSDIAITNAINYVPYQQTQNPSITQESINTAIDKNEKEESKALLKGVLSIFDDDD